ncbi:MAG: HesA/MoeB/ThiF family protein [Firmicutes bacterium]|nr:HesA/MoeB/ThiF family protein [Bacillota bacterium]
MTSRQKERISRLLLLPAMPQDAEERLESARVAIVGVGGLGQSAAQYLAAQGVGYVRLIDADTVAAHNLGRQILCGPENTGQLKIVSARQRLHDQAPACAVEIYSEWVNADNVERLLDGCTVVVDGTDNLSARRILNNWTIRHRRPVVFAGVCEWTAHVFSVSGGQPCWQCLWGEPEDTHRSLCRSVMGPLVGITGAQQAVAAIKLILGIDPSPIGKLWSVDAYHEHALVATIPADPACTACAHIT